MTSLAQSFECQSYKELDGIEQAFDVIKSNPADWIFQLKYDGIWDKIVITGDRAQMFSKTGQLKNTLVVPPWLIQRGEVVLVGEYMFGSQWAQHPERLGKVFVFDCLVDNGQDISTHSYEQRKKIADGIVQELGEPFVKSPSYSIDKLGEIWLHLEQSMKYEGIVLRNKTSTWFTELHKLKTEVEDDYVVLSTYEGEGQHVGRLGGIVLGQYVDGNCIEVMRVGGGFSTSQRISYWNTSLPTVCRVKGKSRFSSGALRHPQFVQFRDDKRPEDCKLKIS